MRQVNAYICEALEIEKFTHRSIITHNNDNFLGKIV